MKGSIPEQVFELARKRADAVEVFAREHEETPAVFEANRLKTLETHQSRGVALRLIRNGHIGFASTTRLDALDELVDSAVTLSEFGAEAKFEFARALPAQVEVYDPKLCAVSVEQLGKLGAQLVERVHAYDSNVLVNLELSKECNTVRIINSAGADIEFTKSAAGIGIEGNLVRGTDYLDVYEGVASCRWPLGEDAAVQALINHIEMAKPIAKLPSRQMPVVFTPKGFVSTIVLPLQMALNGKLVLQGASPLGDKLGETVFDEKLTLDDDGLADWALPSSPFDGDGLPRQRTPLISRGLVASFLYDLQTAGQAGAMSTANASRSLDSLPTPSPTTFVFSVGDTSYDDMIAGIEEGLLVDQVMGAWAGNVMAGEFSATVHLGYAIRNGKVVGRVKGTMVTGNAFDALKRIAAVGDKAEWLNGSMKAPAFMFESLGVASKA